jgi:predicted ATP-dependent endonuclease of OLD family
LPPVPTAALFSNDNKIKVISNISNNKNIIQDNSDVVYEVDNKMLPEDYNGLGYMNLLSILFQIHIALDKLKSINGVSKKADINLLFIEEPEVHTHPQMQYIFIKNIKTLIEKYKLEMNIQTIITTHSAHIVSQSDFNDIKYFKKNLNEEIEIKSLKKLSDLYTDEQDAFYFLKQYLTLNKAELFFADKVIFIEGDTERLLLPAMMKKIDDEKKEDIKYIPLLSQNISFVEVGAYSHVFAKMIQFLGIKTLIITDIDSVKEVFKNGRQIRIACEVCNGKYSSNASIKCFLKTDDLNAIKQSQQNILKIEEKTCVDGIRMLTFVNDDNGKLNIVYQKEIENYYPRSFEDAFFIENKQFIKNHIKEFDSSLKKINQNVQNMNPYKFSNCIIRKTSFALDILYISLKNLSEWNIPQYIKGGLEWLAKN